MIISPPIGCLRFDQIKAQAAVAAVAADVKAMAITPLLSLIPALWVLGLLTVILAEAAVPPTLLGMTVLMKEEKNDKYNVA